MTTVAANRKMMAADSQATGGDGSRMGCVKLHKIGKLIVGFCGSLSDGHRFIDAMKAGEDVDGGLDESFGALILSSSGLWYYENSLHPIKVVDKFIAIGSGASAAMGAMHMGADPKKAVKIAAKCDSYTGGRVRCLEVK